MIKDKFYLEAKDLYDKVIYAYKMLIENFSYKELSICSHEKVFIVEDSYIVYIGLVEKYPQYTFQEKQFTYEFHHNSIEMLYYVHLEELMPNEIFKFVGSKFTKQFNVDDYNFFNIVRFFGDINGHGKIFEMHATPFNYFKYVDKRLPELHLLQRYDNWEGRRYYFVIFEIIKSKDKKSYCIWQTTNPDIIKTSQKKCKDVESLVLTLAREKQLNRYFNLPGNGLIYLKSLKNLSYEILEEYILTKKKEFNMIGKIKFLILERYIKNENDIEKIQRELLYNAQEGHFEQREKYIYQVTPIKWKSEYLVKEICEKLYGKNNVIYQHRPYFLHTKKGQLSYDIYLNNKKIAIEYQGKQHFEPIDYFGGINSFKKQKERDLLKKQLSEQNNIKLIYINYNDPITKEFISNKISEIFKQGEK